MPEHPRPFVAIVDYGLGNLFSVEQACRQAGLRAAVTSARDDIAAAAAVILPGVGAFAEAMNTLRRLDLVDVLRDVADSGKPLLGVCLGMQLLMRESHEFGRHSGLGLIDGEVVRLSESAEGARALKVPHVGWNRIAAPAAGTAAWRLSLLAGLPDGASMYFVHSFYAVPNDPDVTLSTTRHGPVTFCSSLARANVFACQFHPERSGPRGLQIYRNLAALIGAAEPQDHHAGAPGSQVRTA